jgi:hypothetical protein
MKQVCIILSLLPTILIMLVNLLITHQCIFNGLELDSGAITILVVATVGSMIISSLLYMVVNVAKELEIYDHLLIEE